LEDIHLIITTINA